MKRSEPSRRRTVRAVALSGAVLGLAGCATMPSNGPVALGPSASGNTQNTRVELIPVPPADQESPDQLLYGFLDALGSDQSDYRTARLYLSDPNWQPSGAVDVLDSTPGIDGHVSPDGKSYTITASGTEIASLDTHGSYTAAAPGTLVKVDYHFKKNDKGQWRIVDPPQTVLTNLRDFQRIYESVNLFFPSASGQTGEGVSPLVADPVYIRSRVDNPLQTAAQQLLNGPSTWLQPVVNSGFPANPNARVELDTSSPQAKAYLSLGPDADWSAGACRTMAAQLYATLTQGAGNLQASLPTSVALYRDKSGSPVCTTSSEGDFNPVRVGTTAYFLSADHRLRSVTPSSGSGSPAAVEDVSGKLVPAGITIGSFAVSPGADGQVASISNDGRALYVSTLRATTAPTTAALRGGAPEALSSPSWDATGTLWAVDTEPGGTALRAVVGGAPVPVAVQGLPEGATIQQVRVAPDGARIALLLKNGDSTTVEIGRVRRTAGDDSTHKAPSLTVEELRQTAVNISSISSLSWQDGDGLVVVGQQTGTTSVIPVEMDGSQSSLGTIQTLDRVTDVTTLSGDPLLWLFATAKNTDDQNEIFVSQLTAFRWLPITDSASSLGSGVRFPG